MTDLPLDPLSNTKFTDKRGRALRVTGRLKTAIEAMVFDGLSRQEAAAKAKLTDHALYCALMKPHVQAYRKGLLDELRSSKGQRAYLHLTKLSTEAASEHVQMESSKFVAGVAGISPVQKQEVMHSGEIKVTPGYVIDLTPPPNEQPMRDVTPARDPLIVDQAQRVR